MIEMIRVIVMMIRVIQNWKETKKKKLSRAKSESKKSLVMILSWFETTSNNLSVGIIIRHIVNVEILISPALILSSLEVPIMILSVIKTLFLGVIKAINKK